MGTLEMMDVAIFVVSFSSTFSCDIREYLINLKKTTEIIVITGFFFCVCVWGGTLGFSICPLEFGRTWQGQAFGIKTQMEHFGVLGCSTFPDNGSSLLPLGS